MSHQKGDTVMGKTVEEVFPFVSKSNPANSYECLRYTDGTLSCSCPGWTRRTDPTGRACKHTMLVEQLPVGSSTAISAPAAPVSVKSKSRRFDLSLS